ncbi:MAG TPA: Mur ligase family protein [Kofleriaceae bacterium]|nr:Mur ligase family protein [Kofleriaceae bacterium]
MTYVELLQRLVSARRFGMKLGLERMRELLDTLGAPDRKLGTVVHIAGTNGKGSTVAMVAALARSAGKRVATYTSPHLSTLRERITIDGQLVSEDEVVRAAEEVSAAGGDELTFFEQVTAIAFVIIAARAVDITVLEVGLGGRLDATNVVAAPIAAVTGVALDHEAILGTTLDAIAFEKAGIFKRGQRAFIGCAGEPAAVPLLVQHARAAGVAELSVIDEPANVTLALPGAHQQQNAALALALVEALGLAPDRSVLATLSHPGRFEIVGDVILDGAHNPHGARALAATLQERGLRPTLVVAVSADKDVAAIASALEPQVSAVIATRYQQERALAPEDLANGFRAAVGQGGAQAMQIETAPDLATAIARARTLGSPILIAGSLFLVGEARTLLLGAPTDPVVVSDPVSARA